MRLLCCLLLVLPVFADSTVVNGLLLSQAGANHLAGWLGQGDQTFTNVFSIAGGTANGAATFHSTVDGIGPTFILMQTSLGLVGGYNPVSWNSTNNYTIADTDAQRTGFLFDLVNPTVYRQRVGDFLGRYQTYNNVTYGPTFGGGHDLTIYASDLSVGYAFSYSYGAGYQQPNAFGRAGTSNFTVTRVEAYTASPLDPPPPAVPEPTTVTLIGAALGGLAFLKRKKFESR